MTSTPVTLLSKRSGNSSDRPLPTTVQVGELAINFAAADNGLYFKDSAGNIRKVTGTHYATTAPNVGAVGQTGNSVGETWVDSSTSSYYLSVWNGSSWQKIGAAFADAAATATVTIASGAIVANSAIVASGAFGAILASGALGAILSSGSLHADGADLASGVVSAAGVPSATVFTGSFPAVAESGTLAYKNDSPSGLYVAVNGGWALI